MKFFTLAVLFGISAIAAAKSCMTSNDCKPDECCLQSGRVGWYRKGRCAPLSKEDRACSREPYRLGFFRRMYVNNCPCASGLSCKASFKKLGFGVRIRFGQRCVRDITTPDTKTTPEEVTTETDLETKITDVVTTVEITEAPTERKDLDVTESLEDEVSVVTSVPEEVTTDDNLERGKTDVTEEENQNKRETESDDDDDEGVTAPVDEDEDGSDEEDN